MSTITAIALIPTLASPALAWKAFEQVYLTSPTQQPVIQRGWSDVIAANEEYARKELQRPVGQGGIFPMQVLLLPVQLGSARYIVTIASTRSCAAGASNSGSGIEPSECEVRVLDASGQVIAKGQGCFVDTSDDDRPAANKRDRTEAEILPDTNEIRFRSIVGGRFWPRCDATLKLP